METEAGRTVRAFTRRPAPSDNYNQEALISPPPALPPSQVSP